MCILKNVETSKNFFRFSRMLRLHLELRVIAQLKTERKIEMVLSFPRFRSRNQRTRFERVSREENYRKDTKRPVEGVAG